MANTVLALTNSIGTVAVQNIKSWLWRAIAYEGVPYSASNVINGSYSLWGYENYYFITAPNTGAPSAAQQAVMDAFYNPSPTPRSGLAGFHQQLHPHRLAQGETGL